MTGGADDERVDEDTRTDGWPVALRGVTESIVSTLGPNDCWNVAALGLVTPPNDQTVTARTWGNTRTRRNFEREREGVVQFTTDPREFVDAALTVREMDQPVLPGADAWVEVRVEPIDAGREGGTRWTDWSLTPGAVSVRNRRVPTINRGFNAVVEATVAASRLDVPAYDAETLLDRLAYFEDVVDRCGGQRDRDAFERIDDVTGWRERRRAASSEE